MPGLRSGMFLHHEIYPISPCRIPLHILDVETDIYCYQQLMAANDLTPNPVLLRKIRRILAAEEGLQDDLSEEEDNRGARGRRSGQPEAVSSSPFPSRTGRTPRLKSERMSQAPPSRQKREVSMVPNSQGPEEIPGVAGDDDDVPEGDE